MGEKVPAAAEDPVPRFKVKQNALTKLVEFLFPSWFNDIDRLNCFSG